MATSEPEIGLSFRNAIHRLKRLKLKRLDFLVALQRGKLKAFVRLDSRYRFDIPPVFWEKFDTAHLTFSSEDPDFHLSLFDLRDAAIHDIEKLQGYIQNSGAFSSKDLPFLGNWFSQLLNERWRHVQNGDNAQLCALLLSEYLRRGADPLDVLISQKSLDTFQIEYRPKSNAGKFAVPGPDAMWEAVIVLVARSVKPPKIDELYEAMDRALSDRDRNRKDENGNLIYTEELLNTRAKQIRRALSGALRDSENSTN